MPEIKHTFLKGKMNKSLDDRLVPEGEYRDAFNIEVTTDIDGSGDIGTLRKIKGNTALNTADTYFTGAAETIGSFFDDKNNNIYYFVTDGSKHKIYRYNTSTQQNDTIAQGTYLNFSKDYIITGINVLDNFLFWTDDLNPPRRINLDKLTTASYYFDLTDEIKVSVAKYSPFQAPSITMARGNTDNNYIEEKFVRFSYRYKYDDGTYSQLAPFSPIAFQLENSQLTADQVKQAYEQGLIDSFINYIRLVTITAPLPLNPIDEHGISSVEFLMKDDNSAAVRIIKKINVTDNNATGVIHDYQSEIPVSTLAEKELLRVSENVPIKAKSQEIVGNRLVYGNFVENYNIPSFDYTLSVDDKSSNSSTLYPNHSIKQRRTYEVGIVLSDKYGRKSPVILGNNPNIYVPAKGNFDATSWNGDSLKLTFGTANVNWGDWHSYRIVIKQTQQEYYNAYIPGLAEYNGKAYISLLGDNINKIPRDTTNVFEGEFSRSTTSLYPKVINTSTYASAKPPFDVENGLIDITLFTLKNKNQTASQVVYFSNFTSSNIQKFTGEDFTQLSLQGYVDLAIDYAFVDCGSEARLNCANPDSVYIFKNGYYLQPSEYTYQPTASTYGRVVLNEMPDAGDKIDIILKWNQIGLRGLGYSSEDGLYVVTSFTNMELLYVAQSENVGIIKGDDTILKAALSEVVTEPFSQNFTLSNQYQVPSDGDQINIFRIGNLNQFTKLPLDSIPDSDQVGFYKETPTNLIAELDYFNNIPTITQKAVDLAVFETKPFESAIDIYYETPTSGLVSALTDGAQIEIDYYNTFIIKGDTPPSSGIPVWHVEESRIRGDYNADSVGYGAVAHTTNPDYEQTRRENTLIYSGIYNPRTGFNETNQFPQGENITKSLDLQQGSIQKLFAEETSLIVFQEERISNIPIDRDIIYTAEGIPQVVTSNRVLGDPMAYAGNYGIGKNPESFASYAGRKYFVDKPKGAVLRLSRDGITEISNYGMRTYFVNKLSNNNTTNLIKNYVVGAWDMAKRQYVLCINELYGEYIETTSTTQSTVTTYNNIIYSYDATGLGQSLTRDDRSFYAIYNSSTQIQESDLPVSLISTQQNAFVEIIDPTTTVYNNIVYFKNGGTQSLVREDRDLYSVYTSEQPLQESDLPLAIAFTPIVDPTTTFYRTYVFADNATGSNQSLTQGTRGYLYVYESTSGFLQESDLPLELFYLPEFPPFDEITINTVFPSPTLVVTNENPTVFPQYIIETENENATVFPSSTTTQTITEEFTSLILDNVIDESVTLSYDESAQGWVSFYDFNPQTGGSIDGKFYTFKESQIYEHHRGIGFYGATDLTASVDLVVNQNPSANKNFLGINYEGTNSWNIYNIETDFDTAKTIFATDNTKQDNDNEIFLSNFKSFDGKYFANLINNSTEKSDEILFGSSMSGVKGFFLKFKLSSTDQNAELFSVSTNYNINTY